VGQCQCNATWAEELCEKNFLCALAEETNKK